MNHEIELFTLDIYVHVAYSGLALPLERMCIVDTPKAET